MVVMMISTMEIRNNGSYSDDKNNEFDEDCNDESRDND